MDINELPIPNYCLPEYDRYGRLDDEILLALLTKARGILEREEEDYICYGIFRAALVLDSNVDIYTRHRRALERMIMDSLQPYETYSRWLYDYAQCTVDKLDSYTVKRAARLRWLDNMLQRLQARAIPQWRCAWQPASPHST